METTPGQVAPAQSTHEENIRHLLNGMHLRFPSLKRDELPKIVDVNKVVEDQRSFGDRVSDAVAANVGSWRFIIIQSILLVLWIVINVVAIGVFGWDPYPFILLNLMLSFQAAFTGPFVMMSQNRQSVKDRLTAENDYKTDVKGEQEICHIMEHLDHQDTLILKVVEHLEAQNKRIDQQEQIILQLVQKLDKQNQLLESQHEEMLKLLHA